MGFNLIVLYTWLNNFFFELDKTHQLNGYSVTLNKEGREEFLYCDFRVKGGKSFRFKAYKTDNVYQLDQEVPLTDVNGLGTINESDIEILQELFRMLVDYGFSLNGKLGLCRQNYIIEFIDEETKQEEPNMVNKIKQTSYLIQDLLFEEESLFPGFDISVSEKNICFKVRTLTGTDIVIDISDNFSRSLWRHGMSCHTPDHKSILSEEFNNKLKASLAKIGYSENSLISYACDNISVLISPITPQVNAQIPTNNFTFKHIAEAYRTQLQSAMEQQQKQFQDGLAQMNRLREQHHQFLTNQPNPSLMYAAPPASFYQGQVNTGNPINPYLLSPTLQLELQHLKQTHSVLVHSVRDLQAELIKLQAEVRLSKGINDIHDQLVNGKE